MRRIVIVVTALFLGCVTVVTMPAMALWTMATVPLAREGTVIRGGTVWHVVERRGGLVHWVNLESDERLVNPAPDDGALPAWAEPLPRTDDRLTREATLAVGWPIPALGCRWRTVRNDMNFPPPATNDESGWAPKDAVRRMVDGDPAGERLPLREGLLFDALFVSIAWACVLEVGAALLRRLRRGVTRPG